MMITAFDQRSAYLGSATGIDLPTTDGPPAMESAGPKVWQVAALTRGQRVGYMRSVNNPDLDKHEQGEG